jgi:4-amino-4-deoxy-L-arabinose transferase-like glycosyltransferase
VVELEQTAPAVPADPRVTSPNQDPWRHYYPEALILLMITLLAAGLRLWHLGTVPPGLHGDEGWTGIDAHRILTDGWIGAYVPSALGQPSGPLYWTALVIKVLGDGVWQLRFSMAMLGILTIPATYVAARIMFPDRRVAIFSALLLALFSWHLVYSRIAFLVISWPLVEMLVVALLMLAIKRDEMRYYALGGLVLGLGVYTYNVYPLFALAIGIFLVLQLLQRRVRRERMALGIGIALACGLLTAAPLIHYVMDEKNDYFAHHRVYSLMSQPEFKQATYAGKVKKVVSRTRDYLKLVVWGDHPDSVDATGRKATLDWLSLILVGAGVVMVLRRPRDPATQLLMVMLLMLPLGAILSIEASVRRTLGLTPFLVMLMAQPLAGLWRRAEVSTGVTQKLVGGLLVVAVALFALFNVGQYFPDYTEDYAKWVFVEQDARASEYMAAYKGSPYVYFFSGRWSLNYETKRYLAPDVKGEDRSTQFAGPQINLTFDRSKDSLVMLLPPYTDMAQTMQDLYPDGQSYTQYNNDHEVMFTAIHLPKK